MEPLRRSWLGFVLFPNCGWDQHVRLDLPRRGASRLRGLHRFRGAPEAGDLMILGLIWATGAAAVAIYMVAALLRPDRF